MRGETGVRRRARLSSRVEGVSIRNVQFEGFVAIMALAEQKKIRGWALKEIGGHLMSPGPSVSRRFRRADGSFAYAFTVTWVPGTVSLSGDLGELSIVHYHALRTFRDGMEWMAGADYDYLMGKASPRDEVFDQEGSVRFVVEMANSYLRDALLERRSEIQEYVRARNEAREEWSEAFESWAELLDTDDGRLEPAPRIEDFLPDRAEYVSTPALFMKPGYEDRNPKVFIDDIDAKRLPEGYGIWFRIWRALRRNDEGPYDPGSIFTAAGRREIVEALDSYFSDGGQDRAAEFCVKAQISDYYGSTKYKDRSVWQIEALKYGARMILAEQEISDRRWINVLRRALARARARLSGRATLNRRPA